MSTDTSNFDEIVARARAKADAAVAQGIADLEAAIDKAPEWKHTMHQGASRPVAVPVRASLEGMLAHLRESYAANHVDEDGAA